MSGSRGHPRVNGQHSLGKWQSLTPRAEAHEEVRLGKWHLSVANTIESLLCSYGPCITTQAFAQPLQTCWKSTITFCKRRQINLVLRIRSEKCCFYPCFNTVSPVQSFMLVSKQLIPRVSVDPASILKGYSTPKMIILSLFTYPHVL